MKYYSRTVTRRQAINRYGKLGFVPYSEFFKTDNEKFIEKMNKGKKVKFEECQKEKKFIHIEKNKIYEEKIDMKGVK